jgi:hypothetical protein
MEFITPFGEFDIVTATTMSVNLQNIISGSQYGEIAVNSIDEEFLCGAQLPSGQTVRQIISYTPRSFYTLTVDDIVTEWFMFPEMKNAAEKIAPSPFNWSLWKKSYENFIPEDFIIDPTASFLRGEMSHF